MRSLSICLAACTALTLAACGDDGTTPPIDSATAIDAAIDAPAAAPTCAAYCTAIQANCLDAASNRQYVNMADCMASCAFMPVGSPADTQGNTLGCRTYHAGTPAMTNPMMHCPHAGPGGDGVCGMNCQGFCQTVLGACTGANQQYGGNMATCMTACAAFPTATRYNTKVMTTFTFACKMYHATVATTLPALHCPHTSATNAAPCTGNP